MKIRTPILAGLTAIIICTGFDNSYGQNERSGIGIIVGEPTGIAFKQWTGANDAIDAAVAWSFYEAASFYLHADYLMHNFSLIQVSSGRFPIYYGIGGRIKFTSKTRLGAQIPLGASYIFEEAPLDVFIEIRPVLDLIPGTEFTVSGGIGIRYYFD